MKKNLQEMDYTAEWHKMLKWLIDSLQLFSIFWLIPFRMWCICHQHQIRPVLSHMRLLCIIEKAILFKNIENRLIIKEVFVVSPLIDFSFIYYWSAQTKAQLSLAKNIIRRTNPLPYKPRMGKPINLNFKKEENRDNMQVFMSVVKELNLQW